MSLPNTTLGAAAIGALLQKKKRLWFIGIGGIQMSALARACLARGFAVGGSDTALSHTVKLLREEGIPVQIGHHPAALSDYDAAVYTLALSQEDPEYLAAVRLGLPVISRADLLGYLTADFPRRIGVAGSHGKSTVTAMLGEIFAAAGRDPTVFCGAVMPNGSSARAGAGETCIFEACEYGDSFLCLSPTTALILNTEFDHADYFPDHAAMLRSFADFAALPTRAGRVIIEEKEENASAILAKTVARVRTFGLLHGDCHATEPEYAEGCGRFTPILDGKRCPPVSLRIPGAHNVKNALAAALCALDEGISPAVVSAALSAFRGTARRMELRGHLQGARFFDDYAHHPTEIAAALAAAREITAGTGRVFAVFQPHTYSRTRALFADFCAALRAADRVIVADIYPARETDMQGMSAAGLADGIGAHAAYVGGLAQIARTLLAEIAPGDTVLVMGAGDIDRLFAEFCAKHFTLS